MIFRSDSGDAAEVLRLSRDGIWANPDIPADDAAKLVLAAIDSNIKVLVQKAVEAEREACARVCDKEAERALWNWHNDLIANQGFWNGAEGLVSGCAAAIRARSNA